ncbi:MAG: efflux RND transporter permease subunit [Candidatus Omnitrophica bacterium]|nr:efflux RND transporter permease subunit [Candidatus Omnitrophota bacterium]MCF7893456.1 efflux RND transporter permease subunit [Candidatus Omnitrophota bacterium]
MKITDLSLKNKKTVMIISVIVLLGGLISYFSLGKLKNPTFSIATALVVTEYPGASPTEVEKQVTEPLEQAIQRMGSLKSVKSESRAELSTIFVKMKSFYSGKELKQIWNELRERVGDAQAYLPSGARRSLVVDHFGRTYGVFLALTGEGFSYPELKKYAKFIQKKLKRCKDVAGVTLFGIQEEMVQVEISRQRLAEIGINPDQIIRILQEQNKVVPSGYLTSGGEKIRATTTGVFTSLDDIKNLIVKGEKSNQLVLLKDIAELRKITVEPPQAVMRFNGKKAIGIGVSTVSGGNTIVVGDAVEAEIDELTSQLPAGLKINTINFQSKSVKKSINNFLLALIEAIIIVMAVLFVSLGFRSGLVITNGLLFNIAALIIIMLMLGVNLQNVSIAALIIALGMMVDDSVVVSDNILERLRADGSSRDTAGREAAQATGFAQFIATFIAICSFLPIYLAKSSTGQFCESLFLVVAIALSVSWLQAMTVVPVIGGYLFKVKKKAKKAKAYSGRFYQKYRQILRYWLKRRWPLMLIMLGLLLIASYGFDFMKTQFFPKAVRPQFQVNYWLPEGSSIEKTSQDLKKIEKYILTLNGVKSVATSVGSGPPRFMLAFTPEQPNPSYGCMIVNTETAQDVPGIIKKVDSYLDKHFPQAEPVICRFSTNGGPNIGIHARIFGPDPEVLCKFSAQAEAIMREEGGQEIRNNWRQKVKVWVPKYSQPRGSLSGINREDIGQSLLTYSQGFPIGIYREGHNLLPIKIRFPKKDRNNNSNLATVPVWGEQGRNSVPLGAVVNSAELKLENPVIHRLHRFRYISAMCNPPEGGTINDFQKKLKKRFEKELSLPDGYWLEWGGLYKLMKSSNKSVSVKVPIALILMLIGIIILFDGLIQPLMIILTLPLSIIGISFGMVIFQKPFNFLATMGFYCLLGIMIRNGVILVQEIDRTIKKQDDPYQSVVEASVTRIRPVLITAFCTSLGMIPLISDVLFGSMAITIISGLLFATIITLVYLPVLYALLHRIYPKQKTNR